MRKLFTFAFTLLAFAANAQQVDGDFDQEWSPCKPWDSVGNTTEQGTQPANWIISNVCGINGLGATLVGEMLTTGQGNANPNYSVKLTNTANPFMSSEIVPAYISLGTTWATAVSMPFPVHDADGGTFGGIDFSYQPDSIKLYYTRAHGTANTTEKASVIAYLWKGTYTQANVPGNTAIMSTTIKTVDMVDRDRNILGIETMTGGEVSQTDDAECIAKIEYYIEGDQEEWTELTIPFEYTSESVPEKLNIIIAADDYFADRSSIGVGNEICVDNVSLIYNSELASLTYDGQDIFVEGQTAFKVVGEYDESLLECTSNGHGATIETSYDDAARMLTITVKGDDWSEDNLNHHVYTVAFLQAPVYQIPNSDFEAEWTSDKEPGNGWNSFVSAGGQWASFASMSPAPEKVEGYNGGSAVMLESASVFGIANANGNLTTGRINMGSMSPADAANYNFSDIMDPWHCLPFAGIPDSVECYAKFTSGGSENGRGQFILHDEYRYCDPETSNEEGYEAHKIALASILIPECEEWTRFSAPFEYTGTEADEQYMLASFTTNPVPGGSANDELIIDDVRFIYNSELASLTYDGQDIFVAGQANYVVKGLYYEDKLAYTSNGRAATVETDYDEYSRTLVITVKGNDWTEENRNEHVYEIAFVQEAGYQLANASFEDWEADNEPGNGWNSYISGEGNFAYEADDFPAPQKVEGLGGGSAVQLVSEVVDERNVNGLLTTGKVNMGSLTQDELANYSFSEIENPLHSQPFGGTPDSVAVFAKFISGGSENGQGQFFLHDAYEYRDPEAANWEGYEEHKVASASILIPESKEWTRFSAPFEYTGVEAPEMQYVLASFTTNPVRGASEGDTLIVDSVFFIYNSELATLTYDGEDVFVAGEDSFEVNSDTFDESLLAYTANGRAATTEQSFDEEKKVLTITVKGEDWSADNLNQHVYIVTFAKKSVPLAEPVYQIPNADFEAEWTSDDEPGNGWNSFASAGGQWASFASMSPAPEKVEGYNGGSAVMLTSKNLFIANANGNLTTGRINMGSMSPADAANYNFSDLTEGTHCLPFAGTPDSVAVFAKFKAGADNEGKNGRGQFILHDEYEYRDPEVAEDESHKIALAAILIPECTEWTRFSAPFEYTGTETPEKQFLLASFTTNPVPGGSANDTLVVDDVKIIYNSELATLTYDGQDIFVAGEDSFEVIGTTYDETKLECTSNGRAATIEQSYDEEKKVLTITVKGNDWSEENLNQHVYAVTFNENGTGINEVEATTADAPFDVYTLSGVKVREAATDLNGLPRGIYIVNGKKVAVK